MKYVSETFEDCSKELKHFIVKTKLTGKITELIGKVTKPTGKITKPIGKVIKPVGKVTKSIGKLFFRYRRLDRPLFL